MTNTLTRDQLAALLNLTRDTPSGSRHADHAIHRLTAQAADLGLSACGTCGVFDCDDEHPRTATYKITILVGGDHDPSALLDGIEFAIEQGHVMDGLTLDPKAVEGGEAITVEEL
ncbi:MAG: hypothetical protein DRJ42_28120 [Deltaproteobacteria bacterium]|nr:MAG: hypothetical protein DRJ42_28120 [Deltaproteobacteria bacterium]